MKKIFTLLYLIIFLKADADEKTESDLIKDSQICGEHRFDHKSCVATLNCFYIEWFITELSTQISFCFSFDEVKKYFIGNSEEYLDKHGIKNYSSIDKTNFCDIIDDNKNFLDVAGDINFCEVNDD